jgi:hypothetical protein
MEKKYVKLQSGELQNLKDSARESFENRSVHMYLGDEPTSFFNDKHLKSYLITLNFDTTTAYKTAWKNVQEIREKVCDDLNTSFNNDIELIVSTIEHTHEIPKKHKGSQPTEKVKVPKVIKEKKVPEVKKKPRLKSVAEVEQIMKSDTEKMKDVEKLMKNDKTEVKPEDKKPEDKKPEDKKPEEKEEVEENGEGSTVHSCKTLKDIKKKYKDFKAKNKFLKDINETEYGHNLLNIYSEMRYTSNIYKIEDELKAYLDEQIDILTKMSEKGDTYDFECTSTLGKNHMFTRKYEMTLELYLAHIQTELCPTTVGYPHIHIAIWMESTYDVDNLVKEIKKVAKKHGCLKDADISSSKYEGNPLGALEYVCKNHSSKIVNESLFRVTGVTTIIISTITSMRYYKEINEILEYISILKDDNQFVSNSKSKYNKVITMDIFTTKKVYDKYLDPKRTLSPKKLEVLPIKKVDAKKSKKYRYVNYIQTLMERNNLVICNGSIFQKIEGSKSSYNGKCSIADFLDCEETTSEFDNVSKKARELIEKAMLCNIKKLDIKSEYDKVEFPRIELNYRMIEFRDFYFCLITRSIYKTQNVYHTYLYSPEICLANLSHSIMEMIDESVWIKQVQASGIYTVEDLTKYVSAVLPRQGVRDGSLLIAGGTKTGKTTILKILKALFPRDKAGDLSSLSEYHIYEQVRGREIVVINEANTILRSSTTTKGRADVLLMLEGGMATANKKLGPITSEDMSKTVVVMSGNLEKEDAEFLRNGPLMSRMQIILTIEDEVFNQTYDNISAKTECPIVLLFCSMCALSILCKVDYIPNLIIYDELEGDNLTYINDSFKFESDLDQPIRKETDDIFRHSKKKKQGFKIPLTTPFIFNSDLTGKTLLPKRSGRTNRDNIAIMREKVDTLDLRKQYLKEVNFAQGCY